MQSGGLSSRYVSNLAASTGFFLGLTRGIAVSTELFDGSDELVGSELLGSSEKLVDSEVLVGSDVTVIGGMGSDVLVAGGSG